MTPEMTREMFYRILSTEQQKHLEIQASARPGLLGARDGSLSA